MIYSTNHPSLLTDYFGKEYYNIALTNLSDIFKVEKMFDNKYGKTKNSFSTKKDEWGLEYGKKQWYKDDLVIKLEFVQKAGMIGYYMCWVTYEFNEKIKSQIKSNNGNI
jgi:hypothetical protein